MFGFAGGRGAAWSRAGDGVFDSEIFFDFAEPTRLLDNSGTAGAALELKSKGAGFTHENLTVPGAPGAAQLLGNSTAWASTNSGVFEPTQDMRISFWMYVTQWVNGSFSGLVSKAARAGWSDPFVTLVVGINGTELYFGALQIVRSTMSLNKWHHVSLVRSGSTGDMWAFLDGALVDTKTVSATAIDYTDSGKWYLGSSNAVGSNNSETITGKLARVQLTEAIGDLAAETAWALNEFHNHDPN